MSGKGLGAGTLDVLVEDDRGVRTSLGWRRPRRRGGALPAPASGTRVVAVFRGVDRAGEPIVAVGALPLTR